MAASVQNFRGCSTDSEHLLQFYVLPFAAVDLITNFNGIFAFADKLVNKETLLETQPSGGSMRVGKTIKQASMPVALIAMTITRLLRVNFRIFCREAISFDNHRVGKLLRVKHRRQRPGLGQIADESRNSWRRTGRRLIP